MARPQLLSAQLAGDGTTVSLEFDQDMTNAVGDGLAPFVHVQMQNGDSSRGTTVEDISDETVVININDGPAGTVSLPGRVTLIEQDVLTNGAGEPAFPFVNRPATVIPLRLEVPTPFEEGDDAILVWSENATIVSTAGITAVFDGHAWSCAGFSGGGGTPSWTTQWNDDGPSTDPEGCTVPTGTAEDDDGAGNPPAVVPIVRP